MHTLNNRKEMFLNMIMLKNLNPIWSVITRVLDTRLCVLYLLNKIRLNDSLKIFERAL